VLDSIYQRASELKLFLCYGCTGPDLCLEYSAVRRRGTWAYNTTITEMEKPVLYFAMEPITNAAGEPQLFILESKWKAAKDGINASKGYLKTVAAYRTDDNGNDLLFDASDVFVFCTTEYIK